MRNFAQIFLTNRLWAAHVSK